MNTEKQQQVSELFTLLKPKYPKTNFVIGLILEETFEVFIMSKKEIDRLKLITDLETRLKDRKLELNIVATTYENLLNLVTQHVA